MNISLKSICYVIIILAIWINSMGCSNHMDGDFSMEMKVVGDSAMVVTAHPLASKVGVEILRKGGNAYDAAVAVQFALTVVYPRAGNIGGGGFAVCRLFNGKVRTLDFREKAPKGATRDMYIDSNGVVVDGKSTIGIFSVGVPGTVAGMEELHLNYGKLPWKELIKPAIKLALLGFPLTNGESETLNRYRDQFMEVNSSSIPYVSINSEWQEGDSVYYPELAETLFRLGEKGGQEFYHDKIAHQIVAESNKRGGMISLADLQDYEPVWRDPVSAELNGYTVYSMGPPSSGGIAIIQLLKGAQFKKMKHYPPNSASAIHLMTELERRVFADRSKNLGDPDFYDVPVESLLDDDYLRKRFSDINSITATPSDSIGSGVVNIIEHHETTHYSIVDQWGNAVSITTTLNGNFGSKVLVTGAGFFLNNEMDDFSVKPGVPNQFGLIGGEANAIVPEKRMLSSMAPTIIEKEGKLWMVIGTPGGSTIITSVYQTIQNCMLYNMSMQQSVNATKTHSQWLPNYIFVEEGRMDSLVLDSLQNMGHEILSWERIGKMSAIMIDDNNQIIGAADYTRGENRAIGY